MPITPLADNCLVYRRLDGQQRNLRGRIVMQNATNDKAFGESDKPPIYRDNPARDWQEGEIPATVPICNIVAV